MSDENESAKIFHLEARVAVLEATLAHLTRLLPKENVDNFVTNFQAMIAASDKDKDLKAAIISYSQALLLAVQKI